MSKAAVFLSSLLWAASLGSATSALAQDNIQKLLQRCGAADASDDEFYCAGYVGGIAVMMGLNGIIMSKPGSGSSYLLQFSLCAGVPSPSIGASVQAFKNWAQSHPERWADEDFVGVITALRHQWPCS